MCLTVNFHWENHLDILVTKPIPRNGLFIVVILVTRWLIDVMIRVRMAIDVISLNKNPKGGKLSNEVLS